MVDQSGNHAQADEPTEGGQGSGADATEQLEEVAADGEVVSEHEGTVELPEDPVERLELQLAEALASADSFKDRLYRKAADLENTKRRLNKQLEESKRYGTMEVLRELLPVIDDLERAVQHAQQHASEVESESIDATTAGFIDGISLVSKKFISTLERFGLSGFDSVGKTFDPQIHEAINQVETTEHPDGTVIDEFLKGYMLYERLLRPALVIVARNPSESD